MGERENQMVRETVTRNRKLVSLLISFFFLYLMEEEECKEEEEKELIKSP